MIYTSSILVLESLNPTKEGVSEGRFLRSLFEILSLKGPEPFKFEYIRVTCKTQLKKLLHDWKGKYITFACHATRGGLQIAGSGRHKENLAPKEISRLESCLKKKVVVCTGCQGGSIPMAQAFRTAGVTYYLGAKRDTDWISSVAFAQLLYSHHFARGRSIPASFKRIPYFPGDYALYDNWHDKVFEFNIGHRRHKVRKWTD